MTIPKTTGTPRKVLLMRLSSLGDVVLATSAIAPFAEAGWDVHFVTKKAFSPLLSTHPQLKSVHVFDPYNGGEKAARERLFSWCADERFDLILDIHDSLRTRFWRRRLRQMAAVRVVRKERWREILILLFRLGKWVGFGRGGRAHKIRLAAHNALREWGEEAARAHHALTSLVVLPAAQAAVAPLLPREDFIVVLPGSAWPGKKWPGFAALAERSAALAPVVVLGGEEDLECETISQRAKAVNAESRSLRGKTTVAESAAVISKARLIVGNDTGMVHVAEALGKPAIVVEGPTDALMGFSVYRRDSAVVGLDLLCRPCSKAGRICWRLGTRKCLNDLSVETVWNVVEAHWKRTC